ncbi:DUF4893 domain-containing protein [Falsirhodobacter halotolerans]|uniref:DUF4893 domain-containing protein n=1 Tax=Falsirhodobacter halotolerans TaxID=1146892 RepID=UPI001FCFF161|nr:DUF4893 domain-containing protein [Falsirhodobacter halotolerans]MCJ8140384.1 DUF4893 domain-containing protein [Falsirhodobacter halotolerans]
MLIRALALAALTALPASAQMWQEDEVRLWSLDTALGEAMREVLTAGPSADLDRLAQAMAGEAWPAEDMDLTGAWSCTVMKLGGLLPLTVYAPFACRMDADGTFRKTGGSQLTTGHMEVIDGQMVYLGVGYAAGETPPAYADLPEMVDPADLPQFLPQVAVVEQTGPATARMLFPYPLVESTFDVIALTR